MCFFANLAVRYALNVSERAGTTVGRTVGQSGGAGIQQIAIAVPNLVATLRAAMARGAVMLPISPNCYADLGARYGTPQETLTLWQSPGIMMDRDGAGELLHAYTVPFEGRFFFELIERRGGYRGYGGAGAVAGWAGGRRVMGRRSGVANVSANAALPLSAT